MRARSRATCSQAIAFNSSRSNNRPLMVGLVTSVSACLILPAYAQESAPSSGQRAEGPLQEIIVTARKQTESIQDVPLSITALSNASLENLGAANLQDIGRQVPGLSVVTSQPGENTLVLRGISSFGGYAPSVGMYLDDVPLPPGSDVSLLDLDHIEVLRGPQGTLYGASSMGGTVKYVSRRPDLGERSAGVRSALSVTEMGGLNQEYNVLFNQSFVPGRVAVRGAVFYRDMDGYLDAYPTASGSHLGIAPGSPRKNVNSEESYGGRIAVEAAVNDVLTLTPSFFYQKIELGAPYTFDSPPGTFDDPIQSRLVPEPSVDEIVLPALVIEADFGSIQLTSSTSYLERTFERTEDISKSMYVGMGQETVFPFSYPYSDNMRSFTEEVRLSFSAGRVNGIVGAFYQRDTTYNNDNLNQPPGYDDAFVPGGNPAGDQPIYVNVGTERSKQVALFSEVNVDITDQLVATLGARVFKNERKSHTDSDGFFAGGPSTTDASAEEDGWTPKVALAYKITDESNVYVSATKGFRPGAGIDTFPIAICDADLADLGLSGPPTSYDSDSLWSYEAGSKNQLLDRRMTLNASVFYIDWSDVQQNVQLPGCGTIFTGNFGEATSKGAEVEARYDISDEWRISIGGSYTKAELTEVVPGSQGSVGQPLQNVPEWMGSASIEYNRDINATLSAFGVLNFNTTSSQTNNFNETSNYYETGGYSLANFRAGLVFDTWKASLFVNNLFDKRAETALPRSAASDLQDQRRRALNRPRTIGVDLRYDF